MRAMVLQSAKSIIIDECPQPHPAANEVLLRMRAAALNRRDYWIQQGLYPGLVPPVILGSDGVGDVVELGPDVDAQWLGKRCIINPSTDWGTNQAAQDHSFSILGNPRDGTLSEYMSIPVDRLHLPPAHLSDEEAAALPLAGLTAYRALFKRARVQPDDRVLITGIGGGVAQMACAFAKALGCQVVVSSSDPTKRSAALAQGVNYAYDYRQADWVAQLQQDIGGFDVAIDGSGGSSWGDLIKAANYGARIALYGATAGDCDSLPLRPVFWKQLSLLGTTMGSDQDFADMIEFVTEYRVPVVVDRVFPLTQGLEALAYLGETQQMGKIVIRCQ